MLTENEARELTAKISTHLDVAFTLIKQAYAGRADLALGYASWDEYREGEFHGFALRLPRDQRKEAVKTLTEAGMPQRAIAPFLGVDHKTVSNDLKSTGENSPVRPADAPDLDGKVRPKVQPAKKAEPIKPVVIGVFAENIPGDSAPAPSTKDANRRPIVESIYEASRELTKITERLERLSRDDRVTKNREQIIDACAVDLLRSFSTIQNAIEQFDLQ